MKLKLSFARNSKWRARMTEKQIGLGRSRLLSSAHVTKTGIIELWNGRSELLNANAELLFFCEGSWWRWWSHWRLNHNQGWWWALPKTDLPTSTKIRCYTACRTCPPALGPVIILASEHLISRQLLLLFAWLWLPWCLHPQSISTLISMTHFCCPKLASSERKKWNTHCVRTSAPR